MLQHLVKELGRLQLSDEVGWHTVDGRLEPLLEPSSGGHGLGDLPQGLPFEQGAIPADVVQHAAGLVLARLQTGQRLQALAVEAVLDHPRDEAQLRTVGRGEELQFGGVEAELVHPLQSVVDAERLVGGELVGAGQLGPQLLVRRLDCQRGRDRVDTVGQQTSGLEVLEITRDVLRGDRQVVSSLPVRQRRVVLAGLDIDDVGTQRAGIAAEQCVRQ